MEKNSAQGKGSFRKNYSDNKQLSHRRPQGKSNLSQGQQNKAFNPRRRYLPLDWEDGLEGYLLKNYRPRHGASHINDAVGLARLFSGDVSELAEIYNHARGQMKPNLFQKTGLRAAYLSHYFPLNAARTFVLMEEMKPLLREIVNHLPAEDRTIRILDLGCGPGSSGLATAQVFLSLLPADGRIVIDFVDKAPQLLDDIIPLAKELGLLGDEQSRVTIRTHRGDILKDAPKIAGGYHLVLMANILNEVWGGSWRSGMDDKSAHLYQMLLERLVPEVGMVTVLEPATKECTTTLLAFREALKEQCYTLAPCLHNNSCHLFITGGQDWCHSERAWQRPHLIEELDHVTGLDHSLLRWSYWAFTPWGESCLTQLVDNVRLCPNVARLVSGFIPVNKGKHYKLQLCTPAALELYQTNDNNPACVLNDASTGGTLSSTPPEKSDFPRRGVLWYGKSPLEPKKNS